MKFCYNCGFKLEDIVSACPSCSEVFNRDHSKEAANYVNELEEKGSINQAKEDEVTADFKQPKQEAQLNKKKATEQLETNDQDAQAKNKHNENSWIEKIKYSNDKLDFVKQFVMNNKLALVVILLLITLFFVSRIGIFVLLVILVLAGSYLYPLLINTTEKTKLELLLENGLKSIKKTITNMKNTLNEDGSVNPEATQMPAHSQSPQQFEADPTAVSTQQVNNGADRREAYIPRKKDADVINILIYVACVVLGAIAAIGVVSQDILGISLGLLIIVCMMAILIYFVPTLVSSGSSKVAIFIANIFFGWTFLGWLLCLIWSVNNNGSTRLNEMLIEKIDSDARRRG